MRGMPQALLPLMSSFVRSRCRPFEWRRLFEEDRNVDLAIARMTRAAFPLGGYSFPRLTAWTVANATVLVWNPMIALRPS